MIVKETPNFPAVWWLLPRQVAPSRGVDMVWAAADLAREMGIPGGLVHHPDQPPNPAFPHPESARVVVRELREVAAPNATLFVNNPSELAAIEWPGPKWIFVQGAITIIQGLIQHEGLQAAGLAGAWVVMPHLRTLLSQWSPMPAGKVHIVPPFVSLLEALPLPWAQREKELVLFPKRMYADLAQTDHAFLTATLTRKASALGWRVTQLEGLTPDAVAATFRRARLFINTNTMESLNATVVEAMAGGCRVHTYNAVGGMDFLEDGVNARVFENLDVFGQLAAAVEVMEMPDSPAAPTAASGLTASGLAASGLTASGLTAAEAMQTAGYRTAARYHRAAMKLAMAEWWKSEHPHLAPEVELSVVIPTMWRSSKTQALLEAWKAVPHAEVIVIDNAPDRGPSRLEGVKRLVQSENIFVNPAWNLGVETALGTYVILCNDDVLMDAVRWWPVLREALETRPGSVVGAHPAGFNRTAELLGADAGRLDAGEHIGAGWGTMLAMRRTDYHAIPETLRVWWGDQWLAEKLTPFSLIVPMAFEASTTSSLPKVQAMWAAEQEAMRGLGMAPKPPFRLEDLPAMPLGQTGFTHRLATADDHAAIAAGFAEAFHHHRPDAEWQWRYNRPWHPSVQQVGCAPDGRVVAHLGWYLDRAQIQGHPVFCMQGGDVFRNGPTSRHDLGLIREMHLGMFRHLDAGVPHPIAWTYGFQAPVIRARSVRSYGIHVDAPLSLWVTATMESPSVWQSVRSRFQRPAATQSLDEVGHFAAALDALWLRTEPRHRVSLVRDAAWFVHRYDRHPTRTYRHIAVFDRNQHLTGWATIGERLEQAMLVDLVWDGSQRGDLMTLLSAARSVARDMGHEELTTWLLGDSEALAVLKVSGWQEILDPQGIGIVIRHLHQALHPSDVPEGHYVTAGYSDLV